MRDDFCAFVLTHGRPDRVRTMRALEEGGYTGRTYVVIDDEDSKAAEYRERFGDRVLQFSKKAAAETFDEGDNFGDRRAIIYARNTCFRLARELGVRHFIELDDDYTDFLYRTAGSAAMARTTLDDLFCALCDFLDRTGALSVAISQGGDHIGGVDAESLRSLRRKAMNTFVCSTERPFQFVGRINEDVNTYTWRSRQGGLFFTVMQAQVNQIQTQANAGGMTELYLDSGTYVKSFYSVMYCPSSVRIGELRDGHGHEVHSRIHHRVNWDATAPRILREEHRKPRRAQ